MIEQRLFILTNDPVPYGTANANYIRNFAKAVSSRGWKVIVIGMKLDEHESELYEIQDESENKIQYFNINASKLGAKNYLQAYFLRRKNYTKALDYFRASSNDCIVVYTTELATQQAALSYKMVSNSHKAYCEVEWFQPYQYKHGEFSILYILWKYAFQKRAKDFKKAIPISKNLENYCLKNQCETMIVPALIDAEEGHVVDVNSKFVNFIYPGSASDKDSFPCMIKALCNLSDEEKKGIRFHLTGSMTKEKLIQILDSDEAISQLKDVIIYHGWMEYYDLMNLYNQSDYLLLARPENVVTISNFPSKVPEMMNYGIVPVCSKVGDYTETYLQDGYDSIQFAKDNTEACKLAVKKAIECKKNGMLKEMRANARKTAVEKFDFHSYGNRIINFLSKE